MITQKRINVPIYRYRLQIIIFDNWEELQGLIPKDMYDDCYDSRGIAVNIGCSGIVCIRGDCGSTVIHEAEHIKNYIWRMIGYTPQADNDETDAYLLTYLYEQIVTVWHKHNDKKD